MSQEHDDKPLADRRSTSDQPSSDQPSSDRYEVPEIVDYGTLSELTLSGQAPLTDSFMGSAGGS